MPLVREALDSSDVFGDRCAVGLGFGRRRYAEEAMSMVRASEKVARELYGLTPAAGFGTRELAIVRNRMVECGLSRGTVNNRIAIIKAVIKWAVPETMHVTVEFPTGSTTNAAALSGSNDTMVKELLDRVLRELQARQGL